MPRKTVWLLAAALLVVVSCTPGSGGSSGGLEYAGPTEQTVPKGQTMDGSDIQFVNNSPEGAVMLIGDQQAVKKIGDSLNWDGKPVPGVRVVLAQRVLHVNDERLLTGGTIQVIVEDAAPTETGFPDKPLHTYRVPLVYTVRRDGLIPGTTITYAGKTDDGASLTGVSGYRYRRIADSIGWQGRLRPGAYLDVTFRVVAYTDDILQLTGLATIGLTQE